MLRITAAVLCCALAGTTLAQEKGDSVRDEATEAVLKLRRDAFLPRWRVVVATAEITNAIPKPVKP
jgi:hypothetical protein